MRRPFLLLLLGVLSSYPLSAALTERYVSSLAAGGGAGTSGDPLTWSEMCTQINAGSGAGIRYNVKADGTYTRTANDALSSSGTSTNPIVIRGYLTTIGDGWQGRAGADSTGALVTTHLPVIEYQAGARLTATNWTLLESLRIQGNVDSSLVAVSQYSALRGCSILNASTGSSAQALALSSTASTAFECDLTLSGGSGGSAAVSIATATARVLASRIRGGPAGGVLLTSGGSVIACTIYDTAGIGISSTSTTAGTLLWGNTIHGAGGDAIDVINSTSDLRVIVGNHITDAGGFGIDLRSTAGAALLAHNRTRDNASGAVNLGTHWAEATTWLHVDTDTGGPATDYEDAAAGDFRLVSSAAAVEAGVPSPADIGSHQSKTAAAPPAETVATWAH